MTVAAAAGAAGNAAKAGIATSADFVAKNPKIVGILATLVGLGLSVASLLGVIGIVPIADAGEYLTCVYNFFFGFVIVFADAPDGINKCFGLKDKLFKYFGFLEIPIGRAIFLFYVGLQVLLLIPEGETWQTSSMIMGWTLLILGLLMILAQCCGDRCKKKEEGYPAGQYPPPGGYPAPGAGQAAGAGNYPPPGGYPAPGPAPVGQARPL